MASPMKVDRALETIESSSVYRRNIWSTLFYRSSIAITSFYRKT